MANIVLSPSPFVPLVGKPTTSRLKAEARKSRLMRKLLSHSPLIEHEQLTHFLVEHRKLANLCDGNRFAPISQFFKPLLSSTEASTSFLFAAQSQHGILTRCARLAGSAEAASASRSMSGYPTYHKLTVHNAARPALQSDSTYAKQRSDR
jgi:hypothetical protein